MPCACARSSYEKAQLDPPPLGDTSQYLRKVRRERERATAELHFADRERASRFGAELALYVSNDYKGRSTRMLLASRFDWDVTGERVPIFAERGFLLGAKRSRPRCLSGAMRRSQNGGDFFSRHSGISEGRKCWRTRPASESAPA